MYNIYIYIHTYIKPGQIVRKKRCCVEQGQFQNGHQAKQKAGYQEFVWFLK